jgi:hypothetical protein
LSSQHRVAIWIDRHGAVLVRPVEDPFHDGRVLAGLGLHLRQAWVRQHVLPSADSGPGHLYDDLVSRLRSGDRILVLGPGNPKHRLHQKISSLQGQIGEVLDVRNAHEMTDGELTRQAERFFERFEPQGDRE